MKKLSELKKDSEGVIAAWITASLYFYDLL